MSDVFISRTPPEIEETKYGVTIHQAIELDTKAIGDHIDRTVFEHFLPKFQPEIAAELAGKDAKIGELEGVVRELYAHCNYLCHTPAMCGHLSRIKAQLEKVGVEV